ncbi:TetR/AcrR family transcriptional regulator [Polymorphospora rubra]|uniref:TetR/AcrR family transcriptional regulator n=1 Tax=Polymorphospora rubra TaxID=338584 RepID=UPI0033F6AAC8
MVVFVGQGDARRSMTLLWRADRTEPAPARPGRRPGLTVDEIVDAAIALADTGGMAALSMNAVGERLGRTGMALYTYVPGKAELVDLMYDRVLAEVPTDPPAGDDWRATLTTWSESLWEFYLRHPWMLQISHARAVLGPNEYTMLETVVRILSGSNLPAPVLMRVVNSLLHFVRGVARTIAETRQAPGVTGVSDDQWWYARSALLDEVTPDFAERFPTISRLAEERAFEMADESLPYLEQEARETFHIGLSVFLDGIEARIRRTPAGPGPAGPGAGR